MQASELFAEIELRECRADLSCEISDIVSDTRRCNPGCLFVCIQGAKFDSHDNAVEMIRAGAAFVVTERELDSAIPQVLVSDTRQALTLLWSAFYGHPERSFSRVIGITGTNGKTSVSMMLRRILTQANFRCGLIGTTKYFVGEREYDAPLTTPESGDLFRYFSEMREDHVDTLIMEVSSHSLAQKRVAGIPFTLGIFTNLTRDHLDYHGTMTEYRKAKELLFSVCKLGLLNADDPSCDAFLKSAQCECYTFGTGESDFRATELSLSSDSVTYTASRADAQTQVRVAIPGRFTVYNSLAALSAAALCGVPLSDAALSLREFQGVPGRMQRVADTGNIQVLIDFAHTPDALENVLKTIGAVKQGKLITLFGCGGDRDHTKRPLMGEIACRLSDHVFVTSDNSRSEEKSAIIRDILTGCKGSKTPLTVIEDRTEAIHAALSSAEKGDVLLLAGKGHEAYEIDRTGKHPYSEEQIVRDYFDKKKESAS